MEQSKVTMEEIVNLAKRRAFVYPGSEIYGGFANTWDYGPYGVLLKNNVKAAWWADNVMKRADVVGLDAAILMNPKVWEASGHLKNFTDPLVEDVLTKKRYRADKITKVGTQADMEVLASANFKDRDDAFKQILDGYFASQGQEVAVGVQLAFDEIFAILSDNGLELYFVDEEKRFVVATAPKAFNLMFKTHAGPVEDGANVVYMRPETAQGMFVNFKNIVDTARVKLPFGVAQIGKSFRNEITPGNFTFRTREFEQFELEYFCKTADEAKQAYDMWLKDRRDWYMALGMNKDNLRFRVHEQDELAHYAAAACDVEYNFPFGWSELEGIANRGTYDMEAHEKMSGLELRYFDEETKTKILPYVVEPAGGVDRATLAFFVDAYTRERVSAGPARGSASQRVSGEGEKDNKEEEERIVMKFHPRLAPIKVAIFPLVKKEPLLSMAKDIYSKLSQRWFVEYDEAGTVGKRYRRQDEIGTPFCITVDFDGAESTPQSVTVRHRDSMEQERVEVDRLVEWIADRL